MVLSSRIASVDPQIDGRNYVTEIHETDLGEMRFTYMADAGLDIAAQMATRAEALNGG